MVMLMLFFKKLKVFKTPATFRLIFILGFYIIQSHKGLLKYLCAVRILSLRVDHN